MCHCYISKWQHALRLSKMSCSYKWTTLCTIIILSWKNVVLCQHLSSGQKNQVENTNKERTISNNVSSQDQLMNTLLTVAAANGVLPDLLPIIQPSLSNEMPQYQSVKDVPRSLNLIQISPNSYQRPKEPIVVTGKSVPPVNQRSPTILVSPISVPPMQSYVPSQYPYMPSPQLRVCPGPQMVKFENNPNTYLNTGIIQPIPAIWQPQQTVPEISREIPTNPQIMTRAHLEQDNDDSTSIEDIKTESNEIPNEAFESSPSLPINLQINLPAQDIPAPKITVVSARPANPPPVPIIPERNQPPYPLPPFFPPPIIIESSDSMNSWLPMILFALFANDRGNCGSGCDCTCCCPCSNSNSAIPIPYPIPMPVNNPIINSSGGLKAKFRTRKLHKSVSKEDDDDDDDGGGDKDDDNGGDKDSNE